MREREMVRIRVVCVLLVWSLGVAVTGEEIAEPSREDFAEDFVFGSGTSAFQVEGAAAEDGRTPSIWDTLTHTDGRGDVNPKGLEFYNNFINELTGNGIQPHVTLFHYDLPQVLEDEYEGWLNPKIVDDFTTFADVCFREFGDRVSYWTTINEPNVFALGGYDFGTTPPGRCSRVECSHRGSVLEPYLVAHNLLLAHSSAVSLYESKYKAKQHGLIGLNIFMYNIQPFTNSTKDITAAQRVQDFYIGWFMNPLIFGDYPFTMKKFAGVKLPKFTKHQSTQLMGTFDFIGVNYYNTIFVEDNPNNLTLFERDTIEDMFFKFKVKADEDFESKIIVASHGLQVLLEHLKQVYDNPPIYIQENGYPMPHNSSLDDIPRVKYLSTHLGALLNAIRNGSNIKGYFTWSFIDVFELLSGYRTTYGLYYVDFEDKDRGRHPKLSAHWYSKFLKGRENFYKNISVI